jgi:hypothetical protein
VFPIGGLWLVAGLAGAHGPTDGEFRFITPSLLVAVAAFLIAWGAVVVLSRGPVLGIACCALFALGLGLVLLGPLTPYANDRSSRELAARIAPGDRVVAFQSFPTSLPFYLRRPVTLVSDTAHELTSNYVIGQRERLLGRDPLLRIGQLPDAFDPPPAYVVTSLSQVRRLQRLSRSPLEPVYTGRRIVLLRPVS